MTIVSLIVSILSLIVAALAFFRSNSAAKIANQISFASIELQMRREISDASNRMADLSIKMLPLNAKKGTDEMSITDSAHLDALDQSFKAAIQNYLNTYEELCAKYLDDKIDKARFRKSFAVEIRNVVERESLNDYFNATTTRYRAIVKVYGEWENLEQ